MVEVQIHGFTFEKWVCDTFFEGYSGKYDRKWDVPAEQNSSDLVPPALRGLPVSIKTAKYGSPIGLGDVLRQRQIDEPFLMITGFWRQRTAAEKWIEDIGVVAFPPGAWSALWGSLTSKTFGLLMRSSKTWTSTIRPSGRRLVIGKRRRRPWRPARLW